jgi:hypothetical protein
VAKNPILSVHQPRGGLCSRAPRGQRAESGDFDVAVFGNRAVGVRASGFTVHVENLERGGDFGWCGAIFH